MSLFERDVADENEWSNQIRCEEGVQVDRIQIHLWRSIKKRERLPRTQRGRRHGRPMVLPF